MELKVKSIAVFSLAVSADIRIFVAAVGIGVRQAAEKAE